MCNKELASLQLLHCYNVITLLQCILQCGYYIMCKSKCLLSNFKKEQVSMQVYRKRFAQSHTYITWAPSTDKKGRYSKYDISANRFEEQQVCHHCCADICLKVNYKALTIHHVNVPHAFASWFCFDLLSFYINMHQLSLCSKLCPASFTCLHRCAIYLFSQTLQAIQAASAQRCSNAREP